jgi:type VI protein secretion system component VasK
MGCSSSKSVQVANSHGNEQPTRMRTTVDEARNSEEVKRSVTAGPGNKINENTQLVQVLESLKKSAKSKKKDFEQTFELLQSILKKIAADFSNPKFKRIRKANSKFKSTLGDLPNCLSIMQQLGFQDTGSELVFADSLPRSFVQMKLLDLSIAYKQLTSPS